MDYKPNENLSIYYSPAAYKGIIVIDDNIADDVAKVDDAGLPIATIHGNPVEIENGVPVFKNAFNQLGSLVKIGYANKFNEERIVYTSTLALYSNYLKNLQNIDVDWANQVDVSVFKGFGVSLLLNVFYDHDVFVQITDFDSPNGVNGLGRRVNFTEQILAKYSVTF